jgi:hypothetical protein
MPTAAGILADLLVPRSMSYGNNKAQVKQVEELVQWYSKVEPDGVLEHL